MLSAPDADLIRRDSAIPGLALLLDPAAFIAEIGRYLPDSDLTGLQATYLRYKPHTSCLAGYSLQADGSEVAVYAKAFPPGAWDKLGKGRERPAAPGIWPLDQVPGRIVLHDRAIILYLFPNDKRLKSLVHLSGEGRGSASHSGLLQRVFPDSPDMWRADIRTIAYKPERRYVGQAVVEGKPRAALKFYTDGGYVKAKQNTRVFHSGGVLRLPKRIGHSDRHRVLAFEWLEGRLLSETLSDPHLSCESLAATGSALAEMHAHRTKRLGHSSRRVEADSLLGLVHWLGFVYPRVAEQAQDLGRDVSERLMRKPEIALPVHGDFYAKQVLLTSDGVCVLDLDESVKADPASDLGMFIAHLEHGALFGKLNPEAVAAAKEELLKGYWANRGQEITPRDVDLYTAVGLFKLAPHAFRTREPYWHLRTEAILRRAEEILQGVPPVPSAFTAGSATLFATTVEVTDPYNAVDDAEMPFLKQALDPVEVERRINWNLDLGPPDYQSDTQWRLHAIRVARHKPGRRCLVEYDLRFRQPNEARGMVTLLGKARAKSLDKATYRLTEALWDSGFNEGSEDGIHVPQPMGVIPQFQMWFQRKVPGLSATRLLAKPGGPALAQRIAETAWKLHRTNIPTSRKHTMADELRILYDYLSRVAREKPEWEERLSRICDACVRIGASVPSTTLRGIHRDFYPDQVVVDEQALYLIDLDLYCLGDQALDIGNFIGHLREMSIRKPGNADALSECESAMAEQFVKLSGCTLHSIRVYAVLTLARHIYLSTRFPERRAHTEALLEACELNLNSVGAYG